MLFKNNSYKGLKVTVMGLGLHGGGLSTVIFFLKRGAKVTVTDLKNKNALKKSIEELKDFDVKYVLGHHNIDDFSSADLVIKNPAVPLSSPFLKAALSNNIPVETDISVFLREIKNNPLVAVTGSKGKSTTASAVHYCLKTFIPGTKLGGNITISPLNFIEGLNENDPVVLELSSWQLADLKGKGIFNPFISIITSIMPDHMDRYKSMDDYINDKKVIFSEQTKDCYTVFNYDDDYQKAFFNETRANPLFYSKNIIPENINGAYLKNGNGYINGISEIILPEKLKIAGKHNRINLLSAAMACFTLLADKNSDKSALIKSISAALKEFPGIEHRLEYFYEHNGIRFYNDSAATIPQAMAAAVNSIEGRLTLITGGTDKNIDFSGIDSALKIPENIILLEGTGTDKIIPVLKSNRLKYSGPFKNLKEAVLCAVSKTQPGSSIIFSPGCTSFGMFKNEFDRGRQFKKIVSELQ